MPTIALVMVKIPTHTEKFIVLTLLSRKIPARALQFAVLSALAGGQATVFYTIHRKAAAGFHENSIQQ